MCCVKLGDIRFSETLQQNLVCSGSYIWLQHRLENRLLGTEGGEGVHDPSLHSGFP